jgi:hypothetical protein
MAARCIWVSSVYGPKDSLESIDPNYNVVDGQGPLQYGTALLQGDIAIVAASTGLEIWFVARMDTYAYAGEIKSLKLLIQGPTNYYYIIWKKLTIFAKCKYEYINPSSMSGTSVPTLYTAFYQANYWDGSKYVIGEYPITLNESNLACTTYNQINSISKPKPLLRVL